MPRFRCTCGYEVVQGMKPFKCPKCSQPAMSPVPESQPQPPPIPTKPLKPLSSSLQAPTAAPVTTPRAFKCSRCGHVVQGKLKPYSCPGCTLTATMEPFEAPLSKTCEACKDVLPIGAVGNLCAKCSPRKPIDAPVAGRSPAQSSAVPSTPRPPTPVPTSQPQAKVCKSCGIVLQVTATGQVCERCSKPVAVLPVSAKVPPAALVSGSPSSPLRSGEITRIVWRYPAVVSVAPDPQRNCPTIDALGHLYFCVQNMLVSFKVEKHGFTERWVYKTEGRIPTSPIIGTDGLVRVHSSDGYLHTINESGRRAHSPVQVGSPLGSSTPAIDERNVVYVSGYHGGLVRVESGDQGSAQAFLRGKQRLDSTGIINGGVLYIGAENGCVYAVPLAGDRGQNQWDHLTDHGRTGWFINAALALLPGPSILVASHDDCLHAFDLSGRRIWSAPVDGQMLGSPVVDRDGSVYVGLSIVKGREPPRGELVRLDGHSHKIRWRMPVNAPVESTPVIGEDGLIYFGDNDGFIYAATTEGQQVWHAQAPAGVRSAGAISQGLVFFGLENGQIVGLSCDSQNVRNGGWPKFRGDNTQSGLLSANATR